MILSQSSIDLSCFPRIIFTYQYFKKMHVGNISISIRFFLSHIRGMEMLPVNADKRAKLITTDRLN